MEIIATFIRHTLPEYLRKLPVPSSFAGFAELDGRDWAALVPLVGTISFAIYMVAKTIFPPEGSGQINHKVNKSEAKVATTVDVEDLGNKGVFCRCWKSDKFPFCDGSHGKHNKETGDNVGPLIVNCKKDS